METDFALNHDCSNCGMHVVAGHLVRAGYQILTPPNEANYGILTGDSILAWRN